MGTRKVVSSVPRPMRYRTLGRESMLLAQDIRTLDRSPQQRLVIIGAVIGIHVAVIGAFLSGLRPSSFLPEPPGPQIVDVIKDTHHTPLPPQPPITDTFKRPIPVDPQAPTFDTDNNNNTIHDQGSTTQNTPTSSSNIF